MVNRLLNRSMLITVAFMLVVCMSLSSCESLRKKFTRTKKASASQSAEFQPVLEPQDYPAPEENLPEMYKQHYALIKVWYKDLWSGVTDRNNDTTVRYSIKQILDHIAEMRALLKPEKAAELNGLADLLQFYRTSLDETRQARNYGRIQSDLRAFDRMLRSKFREDVIEHDLVSK